MENTHWSDWLLTALSCRMVIREVFDPRLHSVTEEDCEEKPPSVETDSIHGSVLLWRSIRFIIYTAEFKFWWDTISPRWSTKPGSLNQCDRSDCWARTYLFTLHQSSLCLSILLQKESYFSCCSWISSVVCCFLWRPYLNGNGLTLTIHGCRHIFQFILSSIFFHQPLSLFSAATCPHRRSRWFDYITYSKCFFFFCLLWILLSVCFSLLHHPLLPTARPACLASAAARSSSNASFRPMFLSPCLTYLSSHISTILSSQCHFSLSIYVAFSPSFFIFFHFLLPPSLFATPALCSLYTALLFGRSDCSRCSRTTNICFPPCTTASLFCWSD